MGMQQFQARIDQVPLMVMRLQSSMNKQFSDLRGDVQRLEKRILGTQATLENHMSTIEKAGGALTQCASKLALLHKEQQSGARSPERSPGRSIPANGGTPFTRVN